MPLLANGKPLIERKSKVGDHAFLPSDASASKSFYVEWSKDALGGELIIESGRADFDGTWAQEVVVSFKKSHSAQRYTLNGVFLAVRIRISKPIINGSVDVYGCSN